MWRHDASVQVHDGVVFLHMRNPRGGVTVYRATEREGRHRVVVDGRTLLDLTIEAARVLATL